MLYVIRFEIIFLDFILHEALEDSSKGNEKLNWQKYKFILPIKTFSKWLKPCQHRVFFSSTTLFRDVSEEILSFPVYKFYAWSHSHRPIIVDIKKSLITPHGFISNTLVNWTHRIAKDTTDCFDCHYQSWDNTLPDCKKHTKTSESPSRLVLWASHWFSVLSPPPLTRTIYFQEVLISLIYLLI